MVLGETSESTLPSKRNDDKSTAIHYAGTLTTEQFKKIGV